MDDESCHLVDAYVCADRTRYERPAKPAYLHRLYVATRFACGASPSLLTATAWSYSALRFIPASLEGVGVSDFLGSLFNVACIFGGVAFSGVLDRLRLVRSFRKRTARLDFDAVASAWHVA